MDDAEMIEWLKDQNEYRPMMITNHGFDVCAAAARLTALAEENAEMRSVLCEPGVWIRLEAAEAKMAEVRDTHAAEVARLTAAGQALRDATDVLVVGGDPQVGGSPELIRAMNAWDAIAPAARKDGA